MSKTRERCSECDEPTGRAGAGEDSIFLDDDTGPLCEDCSDLFRSDPRHPDFEPAGSTEMLEGALAAAVENHSPPNWRFCVLEGMTFYDDGRVRPWPPKKRYPRYIERARRPVHLRRKFPR